MFDRVLYKTMSYYVWELVFGKINSFFHKFIHPWEMFIAECYIFIGFVATELKKIHYMQLLSNLIVQLLLIVFFIC